MNWNIFFSALFRLSSAFFQRGYECYLGNEYLGTCKLLIECPSAIEMIQNHQHPVLCSYNKYMPMVCCGQTRYYTSTTQIIPDLVPPSSEILSPPPLIEENQSRILEKEEIASSSSSKEETSSIRPLVETKQSRISEKECLVFQAKEEEYEFEYEFGDENEEQINEFPHRVALGTSTVDDGNIFFKGGIEWTCAGSIISNKFILTAAHCLLPNEYDEKTIDYANIGQAVNLTNPDKDYLNKLLYKIIRNFSHPLYKSPSSYHDIGLVEVERPIDLTEFARPICLHQSMDNENTELISEGMGLGNLVESSKQLSSSILKMFSDEECVATYKDLSGSTRLPIGIVDQYQFCAGGLNDKSDSGGGAFQFNPNNNCVIPYIVGVRSFGDTLGLKGVPGVYTRVAAYIPWIESIVWSQSDPEISVTQRIFNESAMLIPNTTQRITSQTNLSTSLSDRKCLVFRETEYEFLELIYQPGKEFSTISVFGGQDALAGEFPHMVALGFSESEKEYDITWQCGGSLINEKFVLTAAHCLSSQDFGNLSWAHIGNKRLDVYNLLQNPGQLVYKIIRRIPHPMYKRPSTYHDIALVELDRPVVFHNEAKPACLPKNDTKPETNAVATGWGLTEDGVTEQNLQKVTLDLFTMDECDQAYESLNNTRRLRNGIVHSNQFCAGGRSGIQDTCQGDSGGPFQFKISNYTGNIWHIHGITSFSKSCGLQGIPGVYTRVASYVPWIESVVWPDEYISDPDAPLVFA